MGDATGIEWTDATWNPVVGCSVVSPGCTNCYAMSMAARIERMQPGSHYAGSTQPSKAGPVWTGKLALAPEHILLAPLKWRKPRRIFVNSMGDLFHEDVTDEWIDQVFAIMAMSPQHTFQVLTKRSARMRAYMSEPRLPHRLARVVIDMFAAGTVPKSVVEELLNGGKWPVESIGDIDMPDDIVLRPWPLPNVWKGVSTEDQRRANERVPDLIATPAAVRFVSAEPLLGPIDFNHVDFSNDSQGDALNPMTYRQAFDLHWQDDEEGFVDFFDHEIDDTQIHPTLDLVIVGGESGPSARPMHPDWARSLRDQCAAAGVAFFFKQWGEHVTAKGAPGHVPISHVFDDGYQMVRVGKANAGRLLDGVEHNAMPEVRA